jgi:hypothetical protein
MSAVRKIAIVLATLVFAGAAQAQDAKPQRIRGDIVSFQGDVLTVHRRSGDVVSIDLKPDAAVAALKPIVLSDIKAGSYVGAQATADASGKLTAASVLVFPEAARGTQEGHFVYDFGANSSMTNANVDNVAVVESSGRELKLSYKGGTNTVTVPEDAPVVTFAPATREDLVAGKKVLAVVIPAQNGTFEAQVVLVEKDGVVPPM